MDFSHNSKMFLYRSDLPHEEQVNGSSEDNAMPYYTQDCGPWYSFEPISANVHSYQPSQLCQYANSFDSSRYDQAAESSETSWTLQPPLLYQTRNKSFDPLTNAETIPSPTSLQSMNTLSPSWDSHSSCRDVSPFPTRLQAPSVRERCNTPAISAPVIRQSRNTTTSPGPTRIRRSATHSRNRKAKAKTPSNTARERSSHWPRHILVRAKILPNEATTELRYFLVVLHSADVQSCANAICSKLGIDSTGHKSIQWANKKSRSQGVVDRAFLSGLDEMQDFVVDIVGVGNNGYVELVLEM